MRWLDKRHGQRDDGLAAWYPHSSNHEDPIMAKGMNQKKETKKKPEKTLKEKRAEKAAKKGK